VRVDDIDLHVELDGDPALPPLVLLHGFTGSVRSWDAVRADLARRFRLVLVDLIGHGQSESPLDAERYTLEWAVRDVATVLDTLALPPVALLGYSMGGRLALRFAVDCPTRVQRLLLESASPGIADARERAARRHADDQLAERIGQRGVAAFVQEWERQPLLALAEHVAHGVSQAQHAQRLDNSPIGLANSLRGMGAGQQPALWDSLVALSMPVRLLVGERDRRHVDIASRMHALLPDSELRVCPRAGHTVHLDQPAAFVEWAVA
jgi:2-succinyl-6-hydroxy-2,4-cyclohexadiene-1-carboxylate synthase